MNATVNELVAAQAEGKALAEADAAQAARTKALIEGLVGMGQAQQQRIADLLTQLNSGAVVTATDLQALLDNQLAMNQSMRASAATEAEANAEGQAQLDAANQTPAP
jgi:hypothetical protein